MNTLQNRLWPNTDGNLGKIKVQIPTGTTDDPWPEGDALVGNFVYKNGKLVGFIDVAALIPNESGETIIPYDTINTKFPGILKDSFAINAGERCKYQFAKLEEDIAVYTSTRLFEIMDADKFKVSYDKDENKVTVAVAFDTTAAQIAEVESLLERVLPRNLVTEFDPVPCDFTRVEYIRSTGTQWLSLGAFEVYGVEMTVADATVIGFGYILSGTSYADGQWHDFSIEADTNGKLRFCRAGWNYRCSPADITVANSKADIEHSFDLPYRKVIINGMELSCSVIAGYGKYDSLQDVRLSHHVARNDYPKANCSYFAVKLRSGKDAIERDLVPVLDNTGAPCMFDMVTRTAYYNSGTGDFLYPGKESEATTYSLRNRMYAKLTEHGVRRLYRVPAGYTMTKDEYAAANGFKELVEPPMPSEGYWMSEWRETETQLICDWVETEPPVEEEIE